MEHGVPRLHRRGVGGDRDPRRSAGTARRSVRRNRAVPPARSPAARGRGRDPARRAGGARRRARRVLRRTPAGDAAPVLRCRERPRQREATAEIDAVGAARDRCGRHGRADDRPAAHRERATRAPGAEAPQHARARLPHHPADRDSRHDRRARPFARARGGDGRPRLRAHPTADDRGAPPDEWPARARRSLRRVRRDLRLARRVGLAGARRPGARRRSRRRGDRDGRGRETRPHHAVPARSLEAARMVGGRVGDPGRGRDVRHRPGRSRRPQPVAATAALAGAPGVLRDRRPHRRTACVVRTATPDRRAATA